MEVVCRDPWSSEVECRSDDETAHDLYDERIGHQRFYASPVIFDDIFREEKIQTLGHAKIMIDTQESYETDDSIEYTELFDREIIREDDLQDIANGCTYECKKIEPKPLFYEFFSEIFRSIEH